MRLIRTEARKSNAIARVLKRNHGDKLLKLVVDPGADFAAGVVIRTSCGVRVEPREQQLNTMVHFPHSSLADSSKSDRLRTVFLLCRRGSRRLRLKPCRSSIRESKQSPSPVRLQDVH
jgi:hypothetical protein